MLFHIRDPKLKYYSAATLKPRLNIYATYAIRRSAPSRLSATFAIRRLRPSHARHGRLGSGNAVLLRRRFRNLLFPCWAFLLLPVTSLLTNARQIEYASRHQTHSGIYSPPRHGWSLLRYKMAYDGPIAALLDKAQWIVVDDGVQVTAPSTSRPRGRPKKKRMRSFLEKDPKTHKCSRCSQWGHHRSTCKNPISQEQGTSQGASSSRPKLPIRREAVNEATSEDELVVDDIQF